LEEGPTGVDKDDRSFGDKIALVGEVLGACMWKSGGGNGPPTVCLKTEKIRYLESYPRKMSNLLDDSLYVRQPLDVVEPRRAFFSDEVVKLLLCSGLRVWEIHKSKNERLQECGRGIGPTLDQGASDVAEDIEYGSTALVLGIVPDRFPIKPKSGTFLNNGFHKASVGRTVLQSRFDSFEEAKVELALKVSRDFYFGLPRRPSLRYILHDRDKIDRWVRTGLLQSRTFKRGLWSMSVVNEP
jgi:hypothetical protein